jgi:hypothetical protein
MGGCVQSAHCGPNFFFYPKCVTKFKDVVPH